MEAQELLDRFRYHSPGEDKAKTHTAIRGNIYSAAEYICRVCPDGRERSIAITKLEEAMFWANASLARPSDESYIGKHRKSDDE